MIPTSEGMAADGWLRARLDRFLVSAASVGAISLVVGFAMGLAAPRRFFASYLVSFLFWVGFSLGCLGLTMLHHLVGGSWGFPTRRPMEAGALSIIPLAVLFLPLALGLPDLYPWARPDAVRLDPEIQHKSAYLNVPFFLVRFAVYFGLWILLAGLLCHWSRAQDDSPDSAPSRRLQRLSGPGLVGLFLTSTFASMDWGMSLEPRWSSTIYGAMFVSGSAVSTLALMIVVAIALSAEEPMREAASPDRLHDLGNLLLAFVMLWAYMAFSQFLIIWSGNLGEEVPWYIRRTTGGWQWVALLLFGFHFVLPFFVLLLRESKRQGRHLFWIAWLVIVMHLVDMVWLVVPAQATSGNPRLPWEDTPFILMTTAGIGGLWLAFFLWQLRGHPLVPLRDPNLIAALEPSEGG
jgi:hypothetical protein